MFNSGLSGQTTVSASGEGEGEGEEEEVGEVKLVRWLAPPRCVRLGG